jgi:hypothetical protein
MCNNDLVVGSLRGICCNENHPDSKLVYNLSKYQRVHLADLGTTSLNLTLKNNVH